MLSRIGRLSLRGLASDAAFARLASSPALAALGALNVTRDLGSSALANLALALPRLRNLVLTGNPIADAGLAHLRAWPALVKLETLYVSNCGLTERGLEALLEGVPLAQLAKLAVSEHRFGDAGADVIASRASCLPALAHLELVDCAISESGALALARALPQLRRLDVRDNDLDASLGRADARIRV